MLTRAEHYLEAEDALKRVTASGLTAEMRQAWATVALAHATLAQTDREVLSWARQIETGEHG